MDPIIHMDDINPDPATSQLLAIMSWAAILYFGFSYRRMKRRQKNQTPDSRAQ